MKTFDLKPQLFDTLKSYNKKNFMSDLMAGIIVGIVALPLAIAFGIASGVTPEKGIITAIVAGFLVSLLGGSKVQIGGPTGAFIVIIYGIIQKYGIEGLTIATIMAGVFLILFGLLKLGTIIKYIPYPIVVGFTSGIAVTIFTTQIKDLFGLTIDSVPSDFIEKWACYIQHFSTADLWCSLVGIVSVVIIAITPKFSKKIPGSLVAISVMTEQRLNGSKHCDGESRGYKTLYCLPCHGWHLNVGNVIAHVETVADSLDRGYSAVLLQQQGGYSHDDDGYERARYLFAELRSDGYNHHTHNAHKRAP